MAGKCFCPNSCQLLNGNLPFAASFLEGSAIEGRIVTFFTSGEILGEPIHPTMINAGKRNHSDLKTETETETETEIERRGDVETCVCCRLPDSLTDRSTQRRQITGMKSKSVLTRGEPVPPALLPRSNRFVEWEPLEIARQLALLEFTNYQAIQPKECQNQSWNGEHRDELAPNISKMITRSNDLPLWIATTILTDTEMKIKLRVRLVRHWIAVAQVGCGTVAGAHASTRMLMAPFESQECRNLNNFNGVMEITAGLQLTSIYRLKKTWEVCQARAFFRASLPHSLTHSMMMMMGLSWSTKPRVARRYRN